MRTLVIVILVLLAFLSCQRGIRNTIIISGPAQGTSYHITYLAGEYSNYRQSIDSIFGQIDLSLSTYVPGSVISRINRNDSTVEVDEHFTAVYNRAMEVSRITGGLFDVTVAPLVNAYGFGFSKKEKVTPELVDSLLRFVGYNKVRLENGKLVRLSPQVLLDFNAIAQGYTVDVLAAFLESKGIRDYIIELGGEIRARGKKLDGGAWTVGIEQPEEDTDAGFLLRTTVTLQDRALATSGNYKKFYVEDGRKYTHIIDPRTGYPAKSNILSATVIATDCMTADAFATSFIVMGLERSRQFLAAHKELGLEVFFIYDDGGVSKTYVSEDLACQIGNSR